jgi:DNA-binding FadR family transcriptional regulator
MVDGADAAATDAAASAGLGNAGPIRLSSVVYDRIINLIVAGQFGLNQRLPSEMRLSEICGVSRPVLREALERLREDGVIVSRKGSGSFVRRRPSATLNTLSPLGSIADMQRLFEFRAGIEAAAAMLAARRWETDDMRRIDAAMEALVRCVAGDGLGVEEDNQLHEAIADATHNQYHAALQHQLRDHIRIGMNVSRTLTLQRSRARMQQVQDEHTAIVAALKARDADAAGQQMKDHILAARRRMFEGVET